MQPMTEAILAKAVYAVAVVFDTPPARMLGRSREARVCDAKFALFHLLRARTTASYPAIGARLKRDHGTVINGDVRAAELASVDKRYAAKLAAAFARFDDPQAVAGELPPIFPNPRSARPAGRKPPKALMPWL